MPITTFSKIYNSTSSLIKKFLPTVCGVPESVLSGISDRYILSLYVFPAGALGYSTGGPAKLTIHAYLQDKFVMNSGSSWSGITQDIPGGIEALTRGLDSVSQLLFNRSIISTLSTHRKWTGSEPISFTFKLKFEAQNDVEKEVLQPCRSLQGLTLPHGGLDNTFFLIPPGPNPYKYEQTENNTRGESIVINIGNFLQFRSVIVKNVRVTYENRMSAAGPIGAEVELTIETWRMLTREELDKAYTEMMRAPADYYLSASTGLPTR